MACVWVDLDVVGEARNPIAFARRPRHKEIDQGQVSRLHSDRISSPGQRAGK
jgi:hypothetical protein